MVNGAIAKTTNIGVIIIAVVVIVGMIFLSSTKNDIPNELSMVLTAAIGYLIGTKFTPLSAYTEKKPDDVAPTDKVVVNTKDTKE